MEEVECNVSKSQKEAALQLSCIASLNSNFPSHLWHEYHEETPDLWIGHGEAKRWQQAMTPTSSRGISAR